MMNALSSLKGRGISVIAKATIPEDVLMSMFGISTDLFMSITSHAGNLQHRAGMPFTHMGNTANLLAATFAAMGQDLGSVGECAQAFTKIQRATGPQGGIDYELNMPCLSVGTVGGGTALPTQSTCLKMIGCTGPKSNFKLAEIIASTCLAGDLSLASSFIAGSHVSSHDKMGRNRPKDESA